MSAPILVVFDHDWADEFQAQGYAITTVAEWEKHLSDVRDSRLKWPISVGFGTNGSFEFTSPKDYEEYFEVIPITPETEACLRQLKIGHRDGFGIFPSIDVEVRLEEHEYL